MKALTFKTLEDKINTCEKLELNVKKKQRNLWDFKELVMGENRAETEMRLQMSGHE